MQKSKVIANYLPQFHETPENSRWWGEGYTDWVAVKNATPLFEGHVEPRVPLDWRYYSLDRAEDIAWQATLARRYGIAGFGMYHYWFEGSRCILGKPAEIIRTHKSIDIEYLFLWDNCSWTRTWDNVQFGNDWAPQFDGQIGERDDSGRSILARVDYGREDEWRRHFEYLLPHFLDDRYIKMGGKPVFGFMQPRNGFKIVTEMASYWDGLAKAAGLPGIHCMSTSTFATRISKCTLQNKFLYTPLQPQTMNEWLLKKILSRKLARAKEPSFYSYEDEWAKILRYAEKTDRNTFLSGFVSFDDTPRRGSKARIIRGSSPEKFERYMKKLLEISDRQGKEYTFVSAWNEWGEGMYLEPDTEYGYGYLEALKKAMQRG